MRLRLASLLLMGLMAAPAAAQVRPGNFSTLNTVDNGVDSLHVGCAVGSSACTGGIKAGPIVASQVTVNSVGIIATDGRIPAISSTYFASLSGANLTGVALLASANIFTGQPQISNATNGGEWRVNAAGAQVGGLATPLTVTGSGSATDLLLYVVGANSMRFRVNGADRWGINFAGDLTFGASADLALSAGTPTKTSGFGTGATVSGSDYVFTFTQGSTANVGGLVTFGHTFANAPWCLATDPTLVNTGITTTTTVQISYASTSGNTYQVHCVGR